MKDPEVSRKMMMNYQKLNELGAGMGGGMGGMGGGMGGMGMMWIRWSHNLFRPALLYITISS